MKSNYFFLLLALCFVFQGCDDDIFLSVDEKLDGEWYFDKVTYTRPFSIGRKNVTSDYEGYSLTFFQNGDIDYLETSPSASYSGSWDIESRYSYRNSEEGAYVDFLELNLVDFDNDDFRSFDWEIATLTRNKLVAEEYIGNRNYRYRLKKR